MREGIVLTKPEHRELTNVVRSRADARCARVILLLAEGLAWDEMR